MSYESLKEIYYKNSAIYEKEYINRITSPATIKFPLFINTKYNENYQLFVMLIPEIVNLMENINNNLVNRKFLKGDNVPKYFLQDYMIKLMLSEIQTTNEIEGVYTKKEDLQNALDKIDDISVRYHFIVKKYKKLIAEQKIPLENVTDVRNIYDDLLKNEIKENDLPDGTLFRKDHVSVYRRSGKGDVIHQGLYPESSIIDALNHLIAFINNDNSPFYIKIAIAHYYLGYIHPFYDGNGRLSRFISTLMIFREKDKLLALKLSKIIKDNIKDYDKVFDLTNSDLNKGDTTPFVLMFLRILNKACIEINKEMNIYVNKLNIISEFLTKNEELQSKVEKDVVFLIYQADMLDRTVTVKDIAHYLDKNIEYTRRLVKKLIEKNYIIRGNRGRKKFIYLSQELEKKIRDFSLLEK